MEAVGDKIITKVSSTFWTKTLNFLKNNWLSILGTMFGGGTATVSLEKANRLFEVLTIDEKDLQGALYIDICQNIKMREYDLTAKSVCAVKG